MSEPDQSERHVPCPRCGYDLRGVVAAWTRACPLDGVCGECGLAVAWSELLSPSARLPVWGVEFSLPRRFARSVVVTLGGVFRPGWFWSRMRMVNPLQPRRLAAYVGLVLLGAYLLFIAGHVVVLNAMWEDTYGAAATYTTTASRAQALLHAALLPGSGRTLATTVTPFGTWPWASSADLVGGYWGITLRGGGALLVMAAIGPLVLAGLRASRRLAGVRAAHLVRLGVYSVGWAVAAWSFAAVLNFVQCYASIRFGGGLVTNGPACELVLMLAITAWYAAWWWAGCGRYLRLQHAAGVAAAVTAIAVLGATVLMWYLSRPFAEYLFDRAGLIVV